MDTGSYKNPLRSLALGQAGRTGTLMDTGSVGMRMDTGRMDTGGGGWLFATGAQDVRPYREGPLPGWDDIFPPDLDSNPANHKMLPIAGLAFPDRAWDPFLLAGAIAGSFAATAT